MIAQGVGPQYTGVRFVVGNDHILWCGAIAPRQNDDRMAFRIDTDPG